MLFSLIVPTLNRKNYLVNLLKSLERQDLKDFEVIIIDQNPIDFLNEIISIWQKRINIIYKNVNFKGACKARNYGAKFANGKYIAFPDDDTEYPKETLSLISKEFSQRLDVDILISNCLDNQKVIKYLTTKNKKVYFIKSIISLFKERIVTSQIFMRNSFIQLKRYEIFDEMMGPGSQTPYASNDETDLLLRSLKDNKKIFVNRNINIFHPTEYPTYKKAYFYGMGRFRLIQKHNLGIIFYLINLIQPVIKLIITFNIKRIRSYLASAAGRSGIQFFFIKYKNLIRRKFLN